MIQALLTDYFACPKLEFGLSGKRSFGLHYFTNHWQLLYFSQNHSPTRHCGLVVSAPACDGSGCEFDSWQCRIYILCSLTLRLLGSLQGSLSTYGLTQKLCLKKPRTLWETLNSILHCNPSNSSPAWHTWQTITCQFIPPIFHWHNWTHSFRISIIWFPDPHLFPIIPPYLSNFNPATFTEIHNLVSPLKCHSSDRINSLSKSCHLHTRDICRIFHLFPLYVATSLANSLFFSKLDYFNSLYNAISQANLNKIKRIQNTLARVVTHTSNWNTSQ